jgi:hypothetical protein
MSMAGFQFAVIFAEVVTAGHAIAAKSASFMRLSRYPVTFGKPETIRPGFDNRTGPLVTGNKRIARRP